MLVAFPNGQNRKLNSSYTSGVSIDYMAECYIVRAQIVNYVHKYKLQYVAKRFLNRTGCLENYSYKF